VEITRSRATRRAIRQRIGVIRNLDRIDVLAGDQAPATPPPSSTIRVELVIGKVPSSRCASLTSAYTRSSRAPWSSQAIPAYRLGVVRAVQ